MTTKALTAAAIFGAGDVACQTLFEGRVLRMGTGTAQREENQEAKREAETSDKLSGVEPFDFERLGYMMSLPAVLVARFSK